MRNNQVHLHPSSWLQDTCPEMHAIVAGSLVDNVRTRSPSYASAMTDFTARTQSPPTPPWSLLPLRQERFSLSEFVPVSSHEQPWSSLV